VRIAVLHPQTAFVRGGAEIHTEALTRALRDADHDAEIVTIAGKWYLATEIVHQMAVWRSFDITESNGMRVDAVIALKFPAYLASHDRKIVWLIHQHRSAYELWDHPDFGDLSVQDDGATVRDLIHTGDRLALGEAKRIFANSKNVAKRLWDGLQIPAEALYHPSPAMTAMLEMPKGDYGDYVFYPSRLEPLKRQSLVIDAMQHTRSGIKLVLVGRGPDERGLRDQIQRLGLGDRVRIEIGVSDDRLHELYLGARAVYFGPYDEDYGYVTIEGLAAARPVITLTDAGGPLEFIEDGTTGLIADPEPRAIAERIDELAANLDAARRMGTAGHELIRDVVPAWPQIVARLLD
jgi:glycosyltransferase involved in cell wall biosynthesis